MNAVGDRIAPGCCNCGHRADVPMTLCDCPRCRRLEAPKDAAGRAVSVGSRVEFDELYQGFAGGVVAELLTGVLGPVAAVEVAPGRRVDCPCRRLRLAD
jgi:hypothetical protein